MLRYVNRILKDFCLHSDVAPKCGNKKPTQPPKCPKASKKPEPKIKSQESGSDSSVEWGEDPDFTECVPKDDGKDVADSRFCSQDKPSYKRKRSDGFNGANKRFKG